MVPATFVDSPAAWPVLPVLRDWQDTCDTVHMWSQIIGKIRLALSPAVNHSWGSALYVTTRGLTTSPIPYGNGSFAIDFDFCAHALRITTSESQERSFPLVPMSVAAFYRKLFDTLRELHIDVRILARPVEVETATPFEKDEILAESFRRGIGVGIERSFAKACARPESGAGQFVRIRLFHDPVGAIRRAAGMLRCCPA